MSWGEEEKREGMDEGGGERGANMPSGREDILHRDRRFREEKRAKDLWDKGTSINTNRDH